MKHVSISRGGIVPYILQSHVSLGCPHAGNPGVIRFRYRMWVAQFRLPRQSGFRVRLSFHTSLQYVNIICPNLNVSVLTVGRSCVYLYIYKISIKIVHKLYKQGAKRQLHAIHRQDRSQMIGCTGVLCLMPICDHGSVRYGWKLHTYRDMEFGAERYCL